MKLKKRLQNGEAVIGSWINTASPIVAELMALTGFDFLTVDAEHSAVDLVQTQALFQAIKAGNINCAAMVRLKGSDYSDTKRYMDAGAAGVIAPLINNADQAAELIRSVKYQPLGMRGVGFCRANNYGLKLQESVETANDETFVCVQIEHADALSNINEIFRVPGIDAAMIGPYDLTASMGITGQFDHPEMLAATEAILSACQRHSIVPGIHVVQPHVDEVFRRYDEGYRFIAYSLDITMLTTSCKQGLYEIRKKINTDQP